jgi:hypothetical protein
MMKSLSEGEAYWVARMAALTGKTPVEILQMPAAEFRASVVILSRTDKQLAAEAQAASLLGHRR